jgi:ribonuclease P protein component
MGGRPDQGLARHQRLTRSSSFREAYDQGQKQVGRCMVLYLRRGEGAALRLGVVTGRKVGPAVARSRARRLLREVYRRHRHLLQGEVDVVLVARAALLKAAWPEIVAEWKSLARRAGIGHEQ